MEIWKPIPGYRKQYLASNYGNIKTIEGDLKYFSTIQGNSGKYKTVSLKSCTHNKIQLVHRIIFKTFIAKLKTGYVIHHKDGNTFNNNASNLIQITNSENLLLSKNRRKREFPIGVYKIANRFQVKFSRNNEIYYLGYFKTKQEAINAINKKLDSIKNI